MPATFALLQAVASSAAVAPHPGAIALMADVVGARLVEWAVGGAGVIVVARTLLILSRKVDACATTESVTDVASQLDAFESKVMAILTGATGDNGIAGTLSKVEKRTGLLEQRMSHAEALLPSHSGRRASDRD